MHSLTREQRDILAHCLGLNHYTQESYRNNFHSDPTPDLEALVDAGLMTKRAVEQHVASHYYHATPEGEKAVREAMKPAGRLAGWYKPLGARSWHFVDLAAQVPADYSRGSGSACKGWRYDLEGRYKDAEPVEFAESGGKNCQKCFAAYARWSRKSEVTNA